jgi:copper homeostasis protein (lipoprotein)
MILNKNYKFAFMRLKQLGYLLAIFIISISACKQKPKEDKDKVSHANVYKGMYSFGPEDKSFKDCNGTTPFWVVDSSNKLELQYTQLGFEKPYVPVYIEVTGEKVPSVKGDASAAFDSTLVVYKVIKITKDFPASCN